LRARSSVATLALPFAIVVAACGGALAPSPANQAPAPAPAQAPASGQAPAPSAGSAPGQVPESAPAPASASALTPAPAPVEMKPPVTSTLTDSLATLGLDPKRLPPLEKLEPRALRGVMKLFAKSLGIKCSECHRAGDFAAPTRRKTIATHMWDDFVAKLALVDGSPVFCDSCHQGRVEQLDRRDKKLLAKWMDDNFVQRLARLDAKGTDCETCHVDMEMKLFERWEAAAAR
jgi:hypothetical protein